MERLTRFVLRHRSAVLASWGVVFVLSVIASLGLSDLLTNRFVLPDTDTHRAEVILEEHFGQRSTGSFTIVVESGGNAQALLPEVRAAAERAAAELPTGRLVSVVPVTSDLVVARIVSDLEPADSKGRTDDMRSAIGRIADATVYVTGQAAIEHDLDPVFADDLTRGELIAVPIALLILVFTFGTLAFLIPFVFAIVTIPTALALVWIFANFMELATYLQNMVTLIGLGIAIDYSPVTFREDSDGPDRDERSSALWTPPGGRRLQRHAVAIGGPPLHAAPFSRFGSEGSSSRPFHACPHCCRSRSLSVRPDGVPPLSWLSIARRRTWHGSLARSCGTRARRGCDRGFLLLLAPILRSSRPRGTRHPARSRGRGRFDVLRRGRVGRFDQHRRRHGRCGQHRRCGCRGRRGRASARAVIRVAGVRFDDTLQHVDATGRFLTSRSSAEATTESPRASSSSTACVGRSSQLRGSPTRPPCTPGAGRRAARTSST
jgi:hypothetical protein